MNVIQQKLVMSYATLVMANKITIEAVPETKLISGTEYPIRSEVEIEIANRTINALA